MSPMQFGGKKPPSLKPLSKRPPVDMGAMRHEAAETPVQEEQEHKKVKIEPYMVCYGDETEVCKNCANFDGGTCEVFELPVKPNDHCNAFVGGDGTEEQGESVEEAMEQE